MSKGRLREVDLVRLAHIQQEQKDAQSLAQLLSKLGMVGERDVAEALASLLDLPLAELQQRWATRLPDALGSGTTQG